MTVFSCRASDLLRLWGPSFDEQRESDRLREHQEKQARRQERKAQLFALVAAHRQMSQLLPQILKHFPQALTRIVTEYASNQREQTKCIIDYVENRSCGEADEFSIDVWETRKPRDIASLRSDQDHMPWHFLSLDLSNVNLADLDRSRLGKKSYMPTSILFNTCLVRAKLPRHVFDSVLLADNADFTGADLSGSKFGSYGDVTDLSVANFTNADVRGVKLRNVDFGWENFIRAKHAETMILDEDSNTLLKQSRAAYETRNPTNSRTAVHQGKS